ncbi:uncharacterized protein PHACADRAFT_185704 [Phanerochaete carnosa HHB-10118-sp]|uniref:Uncharacterized protein n=1 Tax=Phanerochaete carnosa (strain HHB-10118-sp) TaxID=650164 RepID=K5WWP7_PHACS|nr:uncharacterized protein PHACADRAFT_185704 [Phanerochaete carnosa HHB-10118-sp]EKM54872.1 hypothetical protein PHACADRAFT_185704 [Phanerochaete carnosa HHB-10118-sp]
MDAHTLVLDAYDVFRRVDTVEEAVRTKAYATFATLRRLRIIPQFGDRQPYGVQCAAETPLLLRLLAGLEELKKRGIGLEMVNLAAEWMSIYEAVALGTKLQFRE